MTKIRPHNGN